MAYVYVLLKPINLYTLISQALHNFPLNYCGAIFAVAHNLWYRLLRAISMVKISILSVQWCDLLSKLNKNPIPQCSQEVRKGVKNNEKYKLRV